MDTYGHQDWTTVTFKKINKPSAKQQSEGQRKYESAVKLSKLEDPDYVPPKIEKSLGKALQQARLAKKMNQKDLATKLNTKSQTVQQWEAGKLKIPGQYINTINRVLNINLNQSKK